MIEKLELVIYMVVIIGVLVLCYYASRFVARKMGGSATGSSSNMKIIERVAFSQDKCLAICRVCGSYYLVGVANQTIKILAELDPANFTEANDGSAVKVNFADLFLKATGKSGSKSVKSQHDKP